MTGAISVLVVIALLLALAGVITYDLAPLIGFGSRVPLPRHAGHARPAAYPVAATPDEGPARPGGTSLAPQHSPLAREVPLPVETRRLHETGEFPGISQAEADERWWML